MTKQRETRDPKTNQMYGRAATLSCLVLVGAVVAHAATLAVVAFVLAAVFLLAMDDE